MVLAIISDKGKNKLKDIILENNDNFDIETFDTFEDFIAFSTQRTVHFDRILILSKGVSGEDNEQLQARFSYFADYVKTNQKATRVVLYHLRGIDREEILTCFNENFNSVIYTPMITSRLTSVALLMATQEDIEKISKEYGNKGKIEFNTTIEKSEGDKKQTSPSNSKKKSKKKKGLSHLFGGFGKKVNTGETEQSKNQETVQEEGTESNDFYNVEEELENDTDESMQFENFKVNMDGISQNDYNFFDSNNENENTEDMDIGAENDVEHTFENSSADDAECNNFDEIDEQLKTTSETNTNPEIVKECVDNTEYVQDENNESTDNLDKLTDEELLNSETGSDEDVKDNEELNVDIESFFDSIDLSVEQEARTGFEGKKEPKEIVKTKVVEVEKPVFKTKIVKEEVEKVVNKEVLANGLTEEEAKKIVKENRNELSANTKGVLKDILNGKISEILVFLGNSEVSCRRSLEFVKYMSDKCSILYIDLDTKYHPLLGYIDYSKFKNENKLTANKISKIKNVSSLLNYVVSLDGVDYISLDYGQTISNKDLQSMQRIVSECILEYSLVVVNLPYTSVDSCRDLIKDSIKVVPIDLNISSLLNAVISLEKDIKNMNNKMNIIRDIRYLINIKKSESKGDLEYIINKAYERISNLLVSNINWVDVQYTIYYEFDKSTILELLDIVEEG